MVKVTLQKFSLAGSCVRISTRVDFRFTLATFCSSQYLKELFISCFNLAPLKSESGCKDKTFFRYLPNLFQSFFKLFSLAL